jgi:hypothetical protein
MASMSPWGVIQQSTKLITGASFVSTASHGGLRISKGLYDKFPAPVKAIIEKDQFICFYSNYYWFEEDCAFAVPVYFFDTLFEIFKDKYHFAHGKEKVKEIILQYMPDFAGVL